MDNGQSQSMGKLKTRFLRPVNYNVPVTPYSSGGAVCCSLNRQDQTCREFVVQADLNNTSYIAIGFHGTNLINGMQLLAGQGWVFSISGFGNQSNVVATPTSWIQGMDRAQQELMSAPNPQSNMLLNIADFWAAGAGLTAQNLIVFYLLIPESA